MKTHIHSFRIVLVSILFLSNVLDLPLLAYNGGASGISVENSEEVHMVRGDLRTLEVKSLERVSVSNPEIADIVNAEGDNVLMLAKQPGQTSVFLWDSTGKQTYIVRVFEEDLSLVETRIRELLERAGIQGINTNVNTYEGKVVLTGSLSAAGKTEFDSLVEPFNASIINLVGEDISEDLVQVDVQIIELNSSLSKNIGLDWQDAITIQETLPAQDGSIGDLFKIGDFSRTTALMSTVNMLVREGKGRVLSQPKLVVVSGKEASFLVGGEVPVTSTTTTTGGNTQENVEYRDFGVSLTITPTIRENKIDVLLEVEVSDIDTTHSVGSNFAFTTRTAQTQLYLDDEQTIVLAGLIKQNESEEVVRIPFISKIPVVGALFRNRRTPDDNTETELVISLTPKIIQQIKNAAYQNAAKTNVKSSSVAMNKMSGDESQTLSAMNAARESDSIPSAMEMYTQSIQESIARAVSYPDEAQASGWQGTVKLALHVLNDGTLANATVTESSGYSLFDQGALLAAKTTAPYSAFPSGVDLQEINITVPIVYSLNHN